MTEFRSCQPTTMDRDTFVAHFADVYEHSPWVAELVYDQGLNAEDDHIENLHLKMASTLLSADQGKQLALINAHPDLAGRAEVNGELTESSTKEQAGRASTSATPKNLKNSLLITTATKVASISLLSWR